MNGSLFIGVCSRSVEHSVGYTAYPASSRSFFENRNYAGTRRLGYSHIQNAPGFTLVELLVVMAIIAILASFLTPAVTSALGKAKAAKCGYQIHQLLVARQLFTGDNYGNMIPDRPPWPDDPRGWCTWRWYLKERYGISKAVFLCPTAPNAYSETERSESYATDKCDLNANYAQNGNVFGNDSKSRLVSMIPAPSSQVELFETRDYWPDMRGLDEDLPSGGKAYGSWGWEWADGYGVYGYWHDQRLNIAYSDGHVELKKLGRTVTPNCEWDTIAGPHDGATHPEYDYMKAHYK